MGSVCMPTWVFVFVTVMVTLAWLSAMVAALVRVVDETPASKGGTDGTE